MDIIKTLPMILFSMAAATDQGTWSEKAKLGEARTEAGAVFVNGKLYVFGVNKSRTTQKPRNPQRKNA